jgi:ABC-type branched-subunit amino acid transport system substrate-binding protein
MYTGIKIAAEELTAQGTPINVYAYDMGNDGTKMMELVNSPEFASMDLLIGPLYSASNKVAVAFANKNNVALINPISNNAQLLQNNPSAYLIQPSVEMQALQTAEYALRNFMPKSAVILYGTTAKDSIMAYTYQKQFQAKGGKVDVFKKITPTDVSQIGQTISNLDEKTVGHIFVATDNQNVVVNLISALEQKFSKLPIITLSNWLELKMISFEQFERRNVHFIHPEYVAYVSDTVKAFRGNYIKRRNIVPSLYSYQGYDMMMFFGKQLIEHGTFFHQALHQQSPVKGKILAGFNYLGSNDNQYVPLIKFQDAKLILINPIE